MADKPAQTGSTNEGEGSRTGAKAYNEAQRHFVEAGKVDQAARDAEKALKGPEAESLRKAEEIGRSHAKGEDPALRK